MKKNLYVTVLTVITIVLIFVGLVWHVAPFSGITLPWNSPRNDSGNGKMITRDWQGTELGECREISFSINAGDVTLQTGDQYNIRYEGNDRFVPEVNAEEGIWTVKQQLRKNNFRFHDIRENRIVVTIPVETVLGSVEFNVNAGDLNISGINADRMSIDADAGDIDLRNGQIGTLKMVANAGDLDIADTGFTNGSLDLNAGDLKIRNAVFTELSGEMDMGNVEIASAVSLEDASIDLDVDLGDIRINGVNHKKTFHQNGSTGVQLKVSANLGDIKVNW